MFARIVATAWKLREKGSHDSVYHNVNLNEIGYGRVCRQQRNHGITFQSIPFSTATVKLISAPQASFHTTTSFFWGIPKKTNRLRHNRS